MDIDESNILVLKVQNARIQIQVDTYIQLDYIPLLSKVEAKIVPLGTQYCKHSPQSISLPNLTV